MRFRNTVFLIVIFFSCFNNKINGKDISQLGFFSSPETIIQKLKKSKKNYYEHFILAEAYNKKNDYKKAIFHYANSCFKSHTNNKLKLYAHPVYKYVSGFHFKSEYFNDCIYEISNLFFKYGEYDYVVKLLGLMSNDEDVLYRNSIILKAKTLTVLGKHDKALDELEDLLDDFNKPELNQIIKIRIAALYNRKKDNNRAIKTYFEIISNDPTTWESSTSANQIHSILAESNYNLSKKNKLQLGKALFYGKKYKQSLNVLLSISKYSDKNIDVSKYLIKNYVRLKKNKKINFLQNKFKKKSKLYHQLLAAQADEYWKMKRRYLSIPIYKKLINSKDEEISERSLRRTAAYLEDRRKGNYKNYLKKYVNKFDNDTREYFLWLLGRNYIRDKQPYKAIPFLQEAVNSYNYGKYSSRCRFWLYKLYNKQGKVDNANKIKREIVLKNPDSYYTWFLLKKLNPKFKHNNLIEKYEKALDEKNYNDALFYHSLLFLKTGDDELKNKRMNEIDSSEYKRYIKLENNVKSMNISSTGSKVLKNIEKYFRIGSYSAIYRELKALPNSDEAKINKYISLAYYGNQYGNNFFTTLAYIELLKLYNLKENVFVQPNESLRKILPIPFDGCVGKYCKKYKISKYLTLSVMKAESLFNHKAVSPSGAVGLMQLMPATARGIARQLRIKKYDLKNTCTSIHFGTNYLSWLNRFFKGNVDLIVAGYNAGAGNVKKWIRRIKTNDNDFFTEFIPFSETRYYILKTNKFMMQYKLIYED